MKAIGIDLGGTKMSFAVIDENGNIEHETRVPTSGSWQEMKASIVSTTNDLKDIDDQISAIGMGAAGMVSMDGYVHYSPNVPAFDGGVAVRKELTESCGIETFVDNDNNCAGLAEITFGKAKEFNNAVFVGLGTGIGGAIFIDGKLVRGEHGYAGDVGHFTMDLNGPKCACGRNGCFEAFGSGTALGRMAKEKALAGHAPSVLEIAGGNVDDIIGIHVGRAAQAGHADAQEILNEYTYNLAVGFVSLVNILDPGVIVVGGGVVELGDTLFNPLIKQVGELAQGGYSDLTARLIPAKFGEKAGVVGAGTFALQQLD